MSEPKGIPTKYNGINFRSRLEATWAAFFDLVGWKWEYEPFDLEGWIPDFALIFSEPLLVEVKPCLSASDFPQHIGEFENSGASKVLMLGASPFWESKYYACPCGYIWELLRIEREDGPIEQVFLGLDEANWCECPDCGYQSIYNAVGAWNCLRCGKYGKKYDPDYSLLADHWATAKNTTQWSPKRR